jgi:hypothetical protein
VEADGTTRALAHARPEPGAFAAALADMAPTIDGPVVAVLPAEAFRQRPAPATRPGRRTARAALAVALGLPVEAVRFAEVSEPGEAAGRVLVALPVGVIEETRAFLGRCGIALAAVAPEADLLPGRAAPTFAVGDGRWRLRASPVPRMRGMTDRVKGLRPAMPAVRLPRLDGRLPSALLGRGLSAAGRVGRPRRAAVLAGGVAVVALSALWLTLRPDSEVALLPDPVAVPEGHASTGAVDAVQPAPLHPRDLPRVAVLTSVPPVARPQRLAASADPEAAEAVPVTVASRSVPLPDVDAAVRLAVITSEPFELEEVPGVAASEPVRVATLGPVPRPRSEAPPVAAAAAAASPAASSPVAAAGLRPLRRPGGEAVPAPAPAPTGSQALAPAAASAAGRPVARPRAPDPLPAAIAAAIAETEAAPPVVLASLPAGDAGGIAAAAALAGVRPAPRSLAPVPTVPRAVSLTPREPVRAVAAPAPAAQPAPARVAVAVPAPVRSLLPRAPAAPAATAVRALPPPAPPVRDVVRGAPAAAPAVQQPRRVTAAAPAAPAPTATVRGPVTLIGVFGSASARHALLRMPNGDVARVRQGQTVSGVQVAAVAEDSVRVRMNGRDSVLRLPQ